MTMKSGFLIVALTVGLLSGVLAGVSPAGDTGTYGLTDLSGPDPARILGWNPLPQEPIETGALPDMSNDMAGSGRIASSDPGVPLVEIGGVTYRAGLDTGP